MRTICKIGLITLAASMSGLAQASVEQVPNSTLSGPYIGLSISNQSVVSGAAIAGFDVLAEDRRNVTEFSAGYRYPLGHNYFIGAELQYGILDGDLALDSDQFNASITYKADHQFGYGVSLGRMITDDLVIALYAYETEREFDIQITSPTGQFQQQDKQGALRYGLSFEKLLTANWSVKATLGRARTGIDEHSTNISYGTQSDYAVGVRYRV